MRGQPTTFWGKLERTGDTTEVAAWHPLVDHCADVAAVTEALLERTLLRQRLARLGGRDDLGSVDIARLCSIAALHDIGKFNIGFQRKADQQPRDTAGHVTEALDLLGGDYVESGQLRAILSPLRTWAAPASVTTSLLVAAIGHHGRPHALTGISPRVQLWRRDGGLDPLAGVEELMRRIRAWYPDAFIGSSEHLPLASRFQHAFAGLVMLADWLGSDRQIFTFSERAEDRMPFARGQAELALTRIGLDPRRARAALGQSAPMFSKTFGFPPRDAQRVFEGLPASGRGRLVVLESETGSGKTEAAILHFLRLLHAGVVDGMTFALPTRTAATQIHRRMVQAIAGAIPSPDERPPVVLAVPGYVQVDDRHGQRLPGFEVLWNDDPEQRFRYRGWASENPKRYLAGAVVVGTIDQVLMSALRVNHAHLRATALLRHLLVVDEVHASDTYMTRILAEVLRFHGLAGGHALLMSATLGSEARVRLSAAATGSGEVCVPPLEAAVVAPYPVVHLESAQSVGESIAVASPGLAKTVDVSLETIADDPTAIAARALDAARRGARVLVLRNTVGDAIQTQEAIEALSLPEDAPMLFAVHGHRTLHHARFAREDRERLDHAIEARFGVPTAIGGVVAVATQTVQQSLDLDADVLLTDLAPMDVLLQRVGRVHRHRARDPYRPSAFATACATVLVGQEPLERSLHHDGTAGGPHGVGRIYEDVTILEMTRRLLEARPRLRIPEDNRYLVERTTHSESLDELARSLGEAWTNHRTKVSGRALAARGIAELNLVAREGDEAHFGVYAFEDAGEKIRSRLGDTDRRIVFEPALPGPFGGPVRELRLPGWMARGVPTDAQAHVQPDDDGLLIVLGEARFGYTRLGLRPLTSH